MRSARLGHARYARDYSKHGKDTTTAAPDTVIETVEADRRFMLSHFGLLFPRAAIVGGTTSDE